MKLFKKFIFASEFRVKNFYSLSTFKFTNKLTFKDEFSQLSQEILKEKADIYLNLIEDHRKTKLPFLDHSLYKNLLRSSRVLSLEYLKSKNKFLESFYILDKYVTICWQTIPTDDFVELVEEFAKVKYFRFDFWFFVEKRVLFSLENFSNNDLSKLIYAFAYAEQGSDYIWKKLADRVLDIKPRNFTESEFIAILNAFKSTPYKDKLFWAIMNQTLKEIFPNLLEENEV